MPQQINETKRTQIEYLHGTAEAGRSVLGVFEHLGHRDPPADGYYAAVESKYGRAPAMYSTYYPYDRDSLHFEFKEANRRIIEHYRRGALCMVHSQNSWGRFLIEDFKDTVEATDILQHFDAENENRNTAVYERYMLHQKNWGDAIEELKNAGVTVIYRPYVEMTNKYHAECYTCTESGYRHFHNIWRQHYNYMVNERGLDNIIWCFAPQAGGGAARGLKYYPGNDYVDIIGITLYSYGNKDGSLSIANELKLWDFTDYFELGKPFGFSELGVMQKFDENKVMTEPGDFGNLMYYLKKHFGGKASFCCIWSVEQGLLCEKNLHAGEFVNDEFFTDLPALLKAEAD